MRFINNLNGRLNNAQSGHFCRTIASKAGLDQLGLALVEHAAQLIIEQIAKLLAVLPDARRKMLDLAGNVDVVAAWQGNQPAGGLAQHVPHFSLRLKLQLDRKSTRLNSSHV